MADSDFQLPDKIVQHAFDIIADKAKEHAKARAAYEFSERHLKVVLAQAASKSNATSQGQREQDALRSQDYLEALEAFEDVAVAYFTARDRREAASAIISGWQTLRSDARALGKIY